MAIRVAVLSGRRGWPEEDDGAGLGELGPDVGLECSPRCLEVNVAGDEKAAIPAVVLDLGLPLRVVRCHSIE